MKLGSQPSLSWPTSNLGDKANSWLESNQLLLTVSHNLPLNMPGSNDENIIDTETLEIEAGEAEAPELALHLEELNKKNQSDKQRTI